MIGEQNGIVQLKSLVGLLLGMKGSCDGTMALETLRRLTFGDNLHTGSWPCNLRNGL